jgi:DNA polymerase III epsilon subunit-like protein
LADTTQGDDLLSTVVPPALRGQHLAVVDVEGNGQQPPEIIEMALLIVDGETTKLRSWLIRPERPISSFVTRKVHGISNSDVAGSPVWSDVADDIAAALSDRTLVAHHATVEHSVLSAHLPAWRPPLVLDTLRLAKHILPGLKSYGLDHLVEEASIDTSGLDGQRHRAGYDAWCAWHLLCALVERNGLDWWELVKVAALPGFMLPAKHEGGLW